MEIYSLRGSKRAILDLVKRNGASNIDEVSSSLKLAKTTVRRHLLAMESEGIIFRRYKKAGQGRPVVSFALSQPARKLYPMGEPIVLIELLRFLKVQDREDLLRKFFEGFWEMRRESFQKVLQSLPGNRNSRKARLKALKKVLEMEGFMPEVSETDSGITVKECHCPYSDVIAVTDLPCRFEYRFIKWALNSGMETRDNTSNVHFCCSFVEDFLGANPNY